MQPTTVQQHQISYEMTARRLAREIPIAMLLGALLGLLLWMGHLQGSPVVHGTIAAFISVVIYTVATLFLGITSRLLRQVSPLQRSLMLAFLFFSAGAGGWLLAYILLPVVSFGTLRIQTVDGRLALLFAGTLGVLAGLGNHYHLWLRQSLARSMERAKEQELAERELQMARSIQESLLPVPHLCREEFEIVARNLPARYVAGDFYEVLERDDGKVVIIVADVAGKGMAASLVMATVKATVGFVASTGSAAEIARRLNQRLHGRIGARQFVAMAVVVYDPETGELALTNAGLPDPCVVGEEASCLLAPEPRLPLGAWSSVLYGEVTLTLARGESLLIYTDGLPETSVNGQALGYQRLDEIIRSVRPRTPGGLDDLLSAVEEHSSTARNDDCTAALLIRSSSPAAHSPTPASIDL